MLVGPTHGSSGERTRACGVQRARWRRARPQSSCSPQVLRRRAATAATARRAQTLPNGSAAAAATRRPPGRTARLPQVLPPGRARARVGASQQVETVQAVLRVRAKATDENRNDSCVRALGRRPRRTASIGHHMMSSNRQCACERSALVRSASAAAVGARARLLASSLSLSRRSIAIACSAACDPACSRMAARAGGAARERARQLNVRPPCPS
jgi:hypothetical protein